MSEEVTPVTATVDDVRALVSQEKGWEKLGVKIEYVQDVLRKKGEVPRMIEVEIATLASGSPVTFRIDLTGIGIPEIIEQLAVLFSTVRSHVLESAAKAEHVSTGGAMRWSKLPSTTRAMLVTAAARRLGL